MVQSLILVSGPLIRIPAKPLQRRAFHGGQQFGQHAPIRAQSMAHGQHGAKIQPDGPGHADPQLAHAGADYRPDRFARAGLGRVDDVRAGFAGFRASAAIAFAPVFPGKVPADEGGKAFFSDSLAR